MSTLQTDRVLGVDLLYGQGECRKTANCEKFVSQFMQRMVGRYVAEGAPSPKQMCAAVIDLRGFDYEMYMAAVNQIHKGAALRQSRKADRAGLYSKRFEWRTFIPDIVEINQSKEVRSGGPMKEAYRRGIDEMGGPPTRFEEPGAPACPVHCRHVWGIFEERPGHLQGEVVTGEKLVGYIKVKRQGNLAIYTSILGHGDYLDKGIMYRLHYSVMEWIGGEQSSELSGLDFLMYGATDSGGTGLQMWKKRCLFDPAYLVMESARVQ
jgi:hypothetical protein